MYKVRKSTITCVGILVGCNSNELGFGKTVSLQILLLMGAATNFDYVYSRLIFMHRVQDDLQ